MGFEFAHHASDEITELAVVLLSGVGCRLPEEARIRSDYPRDALGSAGQSIGGSGHRASSRDDTGDASGGGVREY